MLGNVAPAVKPGGRLIYSVCTLTRAETTEIVDAFERSHAEFVAGALDIEQFQKEERRTRTSAASITIWPQDFGGNGMFVAAWRRKN